MVGTSESIRLEIINLWKNLLNEEVPFIPHNIYKRKDFLKP